jgi:hypothetical protein
MRRLRAKLDAQNCYPHHRYRCCLLWSFDHSHQFLSAASSASKPKARRLIVSMHSMGVCADADWVVRIAYTGTVANASVTLNYDITFIACPLDLVRVASSSER